MDPARRALLSVVQVFADGGSGDLRRLARFLQHTGVKLRRNPEQEAASDELVACAAIEAAERIVHERERGIGKVTADEVELAFDQRPIASFALSARLLRASGGMACFASLV
jgi:hypothetical protein